MPAHQLHKVSRNVVRPYRSIGCVKEAVFPGLRPKKLLHRLRHALLRICGGLVIPERALRGGHIDLQIGFADCAGFAENPVFANLRLKRRSKGGQAYREGQFRRS